MSVNPYSLNEIQVERATNALGKYLTSKQNDDTLFDFDEDINLLIEPKLEQFRSKKCVPIRMLSNNCI